MKAILRTLLAVAATTLFTACFQVETVVSVKPDGSGTVTEKVVMPAAMVAQMKQMTESFSKGFGGDEKAAGGEEKKGFDLLDEKKLKEAAGKMGTGVTFVSAERVKSDTGEGYTAVYAFTDINQLRIDQNPSDTMPSGPGGPGGPGGDKPKSEPITFQFKKGKVAELTVKNPSDKKGADADKTKSAKPEEDAGGEAMAMQMMQQMFKDMKLSISVEVAGKIVKTDADNVAGNRVTFLEMDFNKLLANPEKLKQLSKANPQSVEETKALAKGVDGIKIESKPAVTIQFQ